MEDPKRIDIGHIGRDLSGDVAGGDIHKTNIYNVGQTPGPDPAALERAYLSQLLGKTRRLSLLYIDPKAQSDEAASPHLELDTIYTALLTRSSDQAEGPGEPESAFREQEMHQLSALAMLNRHKYLVLLGDPGSGKSTFVNFVVLCLAGARLEEAGANLDILTAPLPDDDGQDREERQPWDHGPLLPVRVILREFATCGLLPEPTEQATAAHLWQYLVSTLPHAEYEDPLKKALLEKGGLFLLDGLDEVPEANRRRLQIKQAVVGLAEAFPKCRVLVTSRTYAYQAGDAWLLPDFGVAQLEVFSRGQIRRFVDRWHDQMGLVQDWAAEGATQRAGALKGAIFGSDYLYELAQRPLLLTLMCLLHTHHGSTLPEKRADLYEQTVDLLLHRWERRQMAPGREQREPSLSEWLRVDRDQVRRVLNQLAYDVHQEQADPHGLANIEGTTLEGRLLALAKDDPDLRVARLREYLDHRAGILLPLGDSVFTFPHRTFQEYLAACYMTDLDDFADDMADLVRQDSTRWREVALLAGAKAARGAAPNIWWLAEALCEEGVEVAGGTPPERLAALIAGQAIVESARLDNLGRRGQRSVDRVRGWLKQILAGNGLPADERARAGQVLAGLGDDRTGVGAANGLPEIAWCEVPAGSFTMGEDDEAHPVTLPAYQISRYTITNAQFATFIEAGGYSEKWRHCWTGAGWQEREGGGWGQPRYWLNSRYNQANQPAVSLSWYEAVAFCRWLTERLREAEQLGDDEVIRLPTEAEWEKAARGADGRRYPWGEEPDPDKANYGETGIGAPCAVGCFVNGKSPYGCHDMAGNVWEWCATARGKSYPYDVTEDEWADEYLEGTDVRVLRGGAFFNHADFARAAFRAGFNPILRYDFIGFRVVRAPISSES